MKIAIFSDTIFPQVNGVARTLKKLTDHMEKRSVKFEIFTPEMKDSHSYPNINQFTSLPFFLYPECRTAIANPKKMIETLSKFNPDIIHIATPYFMGLYGIHCGKHLNIPMVASYHTHFDQYLKYYKMGWLSPLLIRYMKWFHQPFERIFVPSHETKDKLESLGFHSLSIWSRGVDCIRFQPDKYTGRIREQYNITEKHLLLFVGRLAPEKDLTTLMQIIEHFPSNLQKNVHWLIVGDGPSYSEVSKLVKSKENVTLTGYLRGEVLVEAYASADLFVFPSTSETFGNVVLESLASGTPAIVSNSGGVKEIVQNNKTGKICMKQDKDSFIKAIVDLLIDEKNRQWMGSEARQYALQQSWECIMDEFLKELEVISYNRPIIRHA